MNHSPYLNTHETFLSIPLNNGAAFQKLRVQLGSHYLQFRIRWMTVYQYFYVDIFEGEIPIALGRGLHPDVDLLYGLNTTIGSLCLRGKQPTIDNLGIENKLEWIAYE